VACDSAKINAHFHTKRITAKLGAKLSVQLRYPNTAHWIMVNGTTAMTCGKKAFLLKENQSACTQPNLSIASEIQEAASGNDRTASRYLLG